MFQKPRHLQKNRIPRSCLRQNLINFCYFLQEKPFYASRLRYIPHRLKEWKDILFLYQRHTRDCRNLSRNLCMANVLFSLVFGELSVSARGQYILRTYETFFEKMENKEQDGSYIGDIYSFFIYGLKWFWEKREREQREYGIKGRMEFKLRCLRFVLIQDMTLTSIVVRGYT